MSVVHVVAAVIVFAPAAVWAVVGGLGLSRRLPRNRWFGVRADESMRSAEAFAVANRVAAPGMLGAAGVLLLSGVLTLGVDALWSILFAVVGIAVALFVVGLVSAYGVRAAAAVPVESDGGCGCCSGDAAHDHVPAEPADDSATAAADCGTSSCGACTLRGVCTSESAQAT